MASATPTNPRGAGKIPKEYDRFYVASLARECTDKAIGLLAKILDDANCDISVRLRAAEVLLDRGWGKAQQFIDITSSQDTNLNMTISVVHFKAGEALPSPAVPLIDANAVVLAGEAKNELADTAAAGQS